MTLRDIKFILWSLSTPVPMFILIMATSKPNEKKTKCRGFVKKTREVMTALSDSTASLEREADVAGGGKHGHDERPKLKMV